MSRKHKKHADKKRKKGEKEHIFKEYDPDTRTAYIVKTTDIRFKLNIFKNVPNHI